MSPSIREVALADAREYFAGRDPEIVIAEGDLVAMVAHEVRGEAGDEYDYFAFRAARVEDGAVAEVWTNADEGSAAFGTGRPATDRPVAEVGAGDPAANKVRVADFFRCVFDAHDPGAVRDFYARGFVQHARTQPQTVEGMEDFVRAMFPDGPIPVPEVPDLPAILIVGEGDLVVIASEVPQRSRAGTPYLRTLFDAFRVRDGRLVEHWTGQDPRNIPRRLDPLGT